MASMTSSRVPLSGALSACNGAQMARRNTVAGSDLMQVANVTNGCSSASLVNSSAYDRSIGAAASVAARLEMNSGTEQVAPDSTRQQ
jgi:maleate cis-trans isomerase